MKNRKTMLLDVYIKYVKKNGMHPSLADLDSLSIGRRTIRYHFGNMDGLAAAAKAHDPATFENIVDGQLFTAEKFAAIKAVVAKKRRFVVTTAVTGCKVHTGFHAAIKKYCEVHDAKLLVITSSDPAAVVQHKRYIDPVLANEAIVFDRLELNSKLVIHPIKLSAKHIDPVTGLGRIGQRSGSFIYASPKQRMKLVPTSNTELPVVLMTTGAITTPDYSSDRYMSHRTAHIAEHDHVIGAIVVEVDTDKRFHFRQIQGDHKGQFADLGKLYSGDKVVDYAPEALVLGDLHDGETDETAYDCFLMNTDSVLHECKPKTLFIHDGFNGKSVNHHEAKNTIIQAQQCDHTLHEELSHYATTLQVLSHLFEEIYIVKSNHDDFLDRYLADGAYLKDPRNFKIGLQLAAAMVEGANPVEAGVAMCLDEMPENIKWLRYDEDCKIAGIECGAHGHKGANGSRGSLRAMENAYGDSVSGHAHTPEILRGAWQVGTTSLLTLDYNKGPSSWLHSSCLVYANGQRQLINIIDGRWRA